MDTSDDLVVDNFYRANFESLYRGVPSPSRVKLLCTADLHYRLPQLDWLVEQAG